MTIVVVNPFIVGGNWSPTRIQTALWLDAADVGTVQLVATDLVATWVDKSGNLVGVQQANQNAMPSYGRDKLNGINVLAADGSNDELRLTCPIPGAGSFSIFTVAKNLGGVDGRSTIGGGPGSTTDFYAHHYYFAPQGGTKWINAWGSASGASLSANNADTGWHVTCSIYNGLNNSSWLDGAAGTVTSKSDSNLSNLLNGWGIFSAGNVGNNFMQGSIAEIVIMKSAADTATRQNVEGYLAWKWGLVSLLTSNHPYKNSPPT